MGSLGKRISEILGIENVVGMDFKFRCDQQPDPVVTVTFYPTRDQNDRIVEVVREYEMVEKTPPRGCFDFFDDVVRTASSDEIDMVAVESLQMSRILTMKKAGKSVGEIASWLCLSPDDIERLTNVAILKIIRHREGVRVIPAREQLSTRTTGGLKLVGLEMASRAVMRELIRAGELNITTTKIKYKGKAIPRIGRLSVAEFCSWLNEKEGEQYG